MHGRTANDTVIWRDDADAAEWDRALAVLGGHPLQSALWGDARRKIDEIHDHRWMALRHGQPIWLARIEERPTPLGWIGWVPRGPVGEAVDMSDLPETLKHALGKSGMALMVTDRWAQPAIENEHTTSAPRTIWVDLTCGLDALYKRLAKQWRYGVGRARRDGVVVDMAINADDIRQFFVLCESVATMKHFDLAGSPALMEDLLAKTDGPVEARLFLARFNGAITAGAFIFRCGRSLHYFWGATDRARARVRSAEAVQWAAIEWGIAQGCTRYDLEGIDPVGNPGTYEFKKKMGGHEMTLVGKRYYPVGIRGRLLAWIDRGFR